MLFNFVFYLKFIIFLKNYKFKNKKMDYNVKLTGEQLIENYNKLISYIEYCDEKQKEPLRNMYEDLSEQIVVASAASMKQFHGAYPGGYVIHVLNVIKYSIELYKLWKKMDADMTGYSQSELIFSALNHDLGKIGKKDIDYYIKNESEWHRTNQGKFYTNNPKLSNIPHEERSILTLVEYGVPFSEQEYIAIRTHNGPLMDANKSYWNLSFDKSKEFKTNLPIIIHYADFMAYRIEIEKEGILKPFK